MNLTEQGLQQNQDPKQIPNNEHLLKALEFKSAEDQARFIMSKYELLNPKITDRLPSVDETLKRKHPPHELRLQEITPEGELAYHEQLSHSRTMQGFK